ncbi:pirin family protein [Telluribacter sp. SYSU D00476]|uniref:pirin family protein n=1 Tax=Telluribacter sp. SYSU D00476 TaxID=2811430 RepID=UPI001FF5D614|nr:pirin-like C-terminal cupin domain-containing protein [Telluribacter sp. SYSU D00476]
METLATTQANQTIYRKLEVVQTPPAQPGFLGPDHTARPVIQRDYSDSDPFIVLMDDFLDKQNGDPVGGPHPHAGFETVSLLIEGEVGDAAHKMKGGDIQIMTAGSGIIHTETIDTKARMRLLQLWLNLPKKDRWALPRVQDLPLERVPTVAADGVTIRVYSGALAGVASPMQNYVPLIVADIQMQPGTATIQQIPAHYTTFLYVLEGSVRVGEEKELLEQDQVGWLDRTDAASLSELSLIAGESGVRVVMYAGEPQHDPIVSHGPFIGDTPEDIRRLYQEFRQGKMQHISTVPEAQRLSY